MLNAKDVLVKLCILLIFYDHATCLIIPEELPTILSLIYSNIPPIKKGTDSRVGVGFRLGDHADFQMLVELGPQTRTDPIGNDASGSKRRRDAMLSAAMKGELGPLAQAVAKYQLERKLQKELARLKGTEELARAVGTEQSDEKKTAASEWLAKWSDGMVTSSEDQAPLLGSEANPLAPVEKKTVQRIGRPPQSNGRKGTISDLTKLYKPQSDKKSE
ncbi:snustorr snarlik [Andrena cerasifolii]|uniref:snustorr snarlik n=1 Tax=Andrena cerasifolii TaxID=2819439 RepID=UPI0040377502